jgi:ABC-type multidrug transport system permease subunit
MHSEKYVRRRLIMFTAQHVFDQCSFRLKLSSDLYSTNRCVGGLQPCHSHLSSLFLQTGYSLYRPAAISVANTLADLPFSAVRILIFNIPVYFITNLSRTGGGFWTFHLFNYLAYITMQGFFRTFGLRESVIL